MNDPMLANVIVMKAYVKQHKEMIRRILKHTCMQGH